MSEFNFFLIIFLIISTFLLHRKLNRIEKLLKTNTPEKDTKAIPAKEKERIETPVLPPEYVKNNVTEKNNKSNENWKKFKNYFLYGIQKDGVSEEYAAATTWLIRAGILILLCAIGFFLKYSIENNLVNPTVRIIFTFIAAMGMFAAGLAGLNRRFHILSIGILSAGVITFYMGAFAGFKLYHILPIAAAFAIMMLATVVSMLTAVKFNLLPIALIGCVGGYLTPVMLSNNSGNLTFFLAYIAVISAGVLITARVYRWRSLEITAFILSFLLAGTAFDKLYNKTDLWCTVFLFINFIIFSLIPIIRKKNTTYGLTEWLLPILACAATLILGTNMIRIFCDLKYLDIAQGAFAVIISAVTLAEGIYLVRKRTDGAKLLPAFLAASFIALATAIPLALNNKGAISSAYSVLAFALIFAFSKNGCKTLLVLGTLAFAAAFCVIIGTPFYIFRSNIVTRFFRGGVFTLALLGAGFILHKNSGSTIGSKAKKIFFAAGGISFLVYSSIEVYNNLEKCSFLHDFRNGGLSVWWAVVAFLLLIAGIRKNYKILRASSMLLFIGCLGKIYIVDIAGLNTLHKVIAFLLTGILFLGGAAAYIIFRKRFSEDKK